MLEYKQHTKCLISGDTNLQPMTGYEKHYLVKSHATGFVFCSRIPTEEELQVAYNQYTREDYLSPVTKLRYNQLLDQLEKYRKTNKILDIGCGVGNFLEVAKSRGWEVFGTEYTDKAIDVCSKKGINMHQGKLISEWFDEGGFDIITSFEVIEHINNPIEEVTLIHHLLRSGGLFYFTTPNFNALERLILKDKYNIISYPEHLSYYTTKTIHYLLSQHQFKRKRLTTTGFSFTRVKTSIELAKDQKVTEAYVSSSSTDERWRVKIESNFLLKAGKFLFNQMLNLFGIGNTLKGWYVKK